MTVCAITHQEITAWANGMNIRLMPFEREALRAIDRAYIRHQNSKTKEASK